MVNKTNMEHNGYYHPIALNAQKIYKIDQMQKKFCFLHHPVNK